MDWKDLAAAFASVGAVVISGLGLFHGGRQWQASVSEREWAEAIALCRVVSDPKETDQVKAMARTRLAKMGFSGERLEAILRGEEIVQAEREPPYWSYTVRWIRWGIAVAILVAMVMLIPLL